MKAFVRKLRLQREVMYARHTMPHWRMPLDGPTVAKYAGKYWKGFSEAERESETKIEAMVPQVRKDGFLTREQLVDVCRWKVGWHRTDAGLNHEEFVHDATRAALSAKSEEMRVGSLRLLKGVEYSVASVFLHWFHNEPYPILDPWALAALGVKVPQRDDYACWTAYLALWRRAIEAAGVKDARMV